MSLQRKVEMREMVAYPEATEHVPMSRAEFDALPEHVKAEYVDGVALIMAPALDGHN